MYSKKAIIMCPIGLYGRSATSFIQLANRFKSTIFVEFEDKKANAKSLLGVLSLALVKGVEINIKAEGVDEQEAVDNLVDYVNSGCPVNYYEGGISEGLPGETNSLNPNQMDPKASGGITIQPKNNAYPSDLVKKNGMTDNSAAPDKSYNTKKR